MSSPFRHFPARPALLTAFVALTMAGCGGGGGSGDPAPAPAPAPTASTASPASPAPTPSPTAGSTALKDNTPAVGASFSNFASSKVTVPVDSVAFVGSRRFVKVARADGAVLFLGEVAPALPFHLTVDAPLGQRRFSYEIFSESASDVIVRGEVNL